MIAKKIDLFQKLIPKYRLGIILVIYGLTISLILILKVQHQPVHAPSWDEAHHLKMGYDYYTAFINHDWQKAWFLFTDSHQIYPPGYHWLIAICYSLFGVSATSGFYANIPFIVILIFATYKLGNLLNNSVGIISAILVPLIPQLMRLQENILIDYASISLFIASFYLLFQTQNLTNTKKSIYFGIALSISLLLKWTFLMPSIPFIFYFFSKHPNKSYKLVFRNILLIIILCSPSIFWIISNYKYIIDTLQFYSNPNNYPQIMWARPSGFNLKNFLLYSFTYPSSQNGLGFIPYIITVFAIIINKNKVTAKYLIISCITLFVFITIHNDKEPKYFAYAYPLLIIVATNSLIQIKNKFNKNILLISFIGSIFLNAVVSNLYLFHSSLSNTIISSTKDNILFPLYKKNLSIERWPTQEIIQKIPNDPSNPKTIFIIPDLTRLNHMNIKYFSKIFQKDLIVSKFAQVFDPLSKTLNLKPIFEFDYILTMSGFPGNFVDIETTKNINLYLETSDNYTIIDTFNTPSQNLIYLYENNSK